MTDKKHIWIVQKSFTDNGGITYVYGQTIDFEECELSVERLGELIHDGFIC